MFKSLLGLIHIIAAVYAILHILKSSAEDLHKVLWVLFVLCFPVVGWIVWYFAGPKTSGRLL